MSQATGQQKDKSPGSTDTQRPEPSPLSTNAAEAQKLPSPTATSSEIPKVKAEATSAPTAPTAQQEQKPPSSRDTQSSGQSTLTDSPLPQAPPSPQPVPQAQAAQPVQEAQQAAPVPGPPTPPPAPVTNAPSSLPARSRSPVTYQSHVVRTQAVRFDIPNSEAFERNEVDAMNQHCRLCCCECPVWVGLTALTIFSLIVFLSFLFWPKTIHSTTRSSSYVYSPPEYYDDHRAVVQKID